MGHWVTLDDDQHVYISDRGKVLATRGAISSASGGKERGKELEARSKAAISKVTTKTTRAIEHAKAAGSKTLADAKKSGREELIRGPAGFESRSQVAARLKRIGFKRAAIDEYMKSPPKKSTDRIIGGMLGGLRAGKARLAATDRVKQAQAKAAKDMAQANEFRRTQFGPVKRG
jgi:hypothetical protein